MDLETLREHVGPGPADDVLERLLNAALHAVEERYGPASQPVAETLSPFGSLIFLSRRAESVESVRDGLTLLDYDQYELVGAGRRLRRVNDDGNPIDWTGPCDVEYVPYSDDAERDRVMVALVELDLNKSPGMTSSMVGAWSAQFPNNSAWNYQRERESILASLRPRTFGVW